MPKRPTKHLADPTKLKPVDSASGVVQVIIETPKGSRNKFAFDPQQEIFNGNRKMSHFTHRLYPDGSWDSVCMTAISPLY